MLIHDLMFPHWIDGAPCLTRVFYALLSVLLCFAIIMSRKREHDYLLSLSSYDYCSVAAPHGAMGLSEVCNCGTFWSYSLNFYRSIHMSLVLIT